MIVLGLAGHAGSGKDTVADYLVERYGFIKFSFSDALYREVAAAFGLENEDLLRDRNTKEEPSHLLELLQCVNPEFYPVAMQKLETEYSRDLNPSLDAMPLSPRWVLQTWGSEYRRGQDPNYWTLAAADWVARIRAMTPYPELRAQRFVNCSVRFANEREFIMSFGDSNIWHIHRDAAAPVNPHESETPLPVLEGEREIWNNYTIEYLRMGIDQLMNSSIPSIRIEPPEPMAPPSYASANLPAENI